MPDDDRRSRKALALMEHALIATRGVTVEDAEACNHGFGRARDFLLHADARPMVWRGVSLSAEDITALRSEALEELRAICAACGLCCRHGMKPP